jgi:DNA-binding response OmpR family regulator
MTGQTVRSILVVDDETHIRNMLARALQAEGYQVQTVATGAAALDTVAGHPPDLVVLNLYLPDMNGLHVLERLLAGRPSLIVLIVSAAPDVESRVAALDAGARDFLPRPFALAELLARVRAGLRSSPAAQLQNSSPDHPDTRSAGVGAAVRRRRSIELTGRALDRLRAESGTDAVNAAVDQAHAAITDTERGPLAEALRALLVEIGRCQHAGRSSSPELEARFRAAVAALAHPDT